MTTKSTTQVDNYFRRARTFYPSLGIQSLKKQERDAEFLRRFGLPITIKKSWYSGGIRPLYWQLLNLVEENQALKQSQKYN